MGTTGPRGGGTNPGAWRTTATEAVGTRRATGAAAVGSSGGGQRWPSTRSRQRVTSRATMAVSGQWRTGSGGSVRQRRSTRGGWAAVAGGSGGGGQQRRLARRRWRSGGRRGGGEGEYSGSG